MDGQDALAMKLLLETVATSPSAENLFGLGEFFLRKKSFSEAQRAVRY